MPSFAQCPDGTPPPCGARAAAAGPSANSVAVMMFTNLARDTSYAYLADGLASEIATSLARVPRLEVRSPGAVRGVQRGLAADPRAVGRRLNVRYVVEGDFQRGADRIRISVRLVTVASGTQRWSDAYTRPVTDLLAVQEEIASAVATAIGGQLLPQERTVLAARPTRHPEAYDHFLRGNFLLAQRTPLSVRRAIDEYTAALGLDPSLAQAQARVALGYALYLDWGWDFPGVPVDSQLARGSAAADRAVATDSASADAWMARGYLLSFRNPRTLEGVLEAFARATSLDPRNAEAWHQYSYFLTLPGRFEEGVVAARRALALEPVRAVTLYQLAGMFEARRLDAEAIQWYDSAIAVDPGFSGAYANRTWLRLRRGDLAGARRDAEAALRTSPPGEEYFGLAPLAAVAARSGDRATARIQMARALGLLAGRGVGPIAAALVANGLILTGQPQEAIDWLERARPLSPLLWFLIQRAAFDPLRGDPRFERLTAELRPSIAP